MLTKHIKPSYGMLVLVFFFNMIIFLLVDIFFKVSGSWFIVKNISSFLLDDIFHFGLWRPNSTLQLLVVHRAIALSTSSLVILKLLQRIIFFAILKE